MTRFVVVAFGLLIAAQLIMPGVVWAEPWTAAVTADFEIAQQSSHVGSPDTKVVRLQSLAFDTIKDEKNGVFPHPTRALKDETGVGGKATNGRGSENGIGDRRVLPMEMKRRVKQGIEKTGERNEIETLVQAKVKKTKKISKKKKKEKMEKKKATMKKKKLMMRTMIPTMGPHANRTIKPTTKSPTAKPTKIPTAKPIDDRALPLQGGGGATNGQTTNFFSQGGVHPKGLVCGSIQAVLPHPTNADICYAGASNGGVWRTTSCTAAIPNWEPLTDHQESLSIGDLVYDKSDLSFSTILVGIAARTSFYSYGGAEIGLLYTQNALDPVPVWTNLDNAAGAVNFRKEHVQFVSVFARGELMLAAAFATSAEDDPCPNTGIFRSTNRGTTWTNVLRGTARAMASDPNDVNRFYATVDRTVECNTGIMPIGVYTSSDQGATWTPTTSQYRPGGLLEGQISNAKLSVSSDGSRVWSSLVKFSGFENFLFDISFSDNHGTSWTRMDVIGTTNRLGDSYGLIQAQGRIHFSMLAAPNDRNEIYAGGDRQNDPLPNEIGAETFSGRFFRGNANVTATGEIPSPQWEHMTDANNITEIPQGGTASSSGPHADSRDMELRADGSIIEGNDGGIAIRTSPSDNKGDWFSACGNLVALESHSVAYEPVLRSVLYGTQDTGTILATPNMTFHSTLGEGDGNAVMIDYTSDPTYLYFYYGFPGELYRKPILKSNGTQLNDQEKRIDTTVSLDFVSLFAMNPKDQKTFAAGDASSSAIAVTRNRGDSFQTISLDTSIITAMSWSSDGSILYFSDDEGTFGKCTGSRSMTCRVVGKIPQGCRDIAVNPSDALDVFAISKDIIEPPAVFHTTDGGVTWKSAAGTPRTNPLRTAARGAALTFVSKGSINTLVVGTSNGILVPHQGGSSSGWKVLDDNIPKVIIMQMVYNQEDDLLVMATLGRGIWVLTNASVKVAKVLGLTQTEMVNNAIGAGDSEVFVSNDHSMPLTQLTLAGNAPSRPHVIASAPLLTGQGSNTHCPIASFAFDDDNTTTTPGK